MDHHTPIKTVLIVDDETPFILSLTTGLKTFRSKYNILTAKNGKQAVEIMESAPVDLVVTDLRMPEMDGFELLAYMGTNFPSIPAIVMSAFGTQEIKKQIMTMGTLGFLEKPIDFQELANAINDGLNHEKKGGSLKGISIASFLQLIEMEEKTCLLDIKGEQASMNGIFYFNKGVLYDAVCGNLRGEDAAMEVIGWENAEIRFKELPKKKISRRVETGLMSLIMEAMRRKDEFEIQEAEDLIEIEDVTDELLDLSDQTPLEENSLAEKRLDHPEPNLVMKPLDRGSLPGTIKQGLEASAEEGVLTRISLKSFLQRIEMEQKTCLLEIQGKDNEGHEGYLFFKNGELYDAMHSEKRGESAALIILGLENVKVKSVKLPHKMSDKTIEKPLKKLFMEASRVKDEARAEEDVSSLGDVPEGTGMELEGEAPERGTTEGKSSREEPGSLTMEVDSPETPGEKPEGGDKERGTAESSGDRISEVSKASQTFITKGGNQMALKDVLMEMAGEIDNLIATGVQGMDGVELAKHSPVNAPSEQFAARFAMVMKLEQNVCKELNQLGALEENIMQTENAFVYTSMLGERHYLGIAVTKEGTLGMVRMVAQKYAEKFKAELGL